MAEATLNDVTNQLMILNVQQGNTTDAVNSLVKRFQEMLAFNKRKSLDDAEAAREAKSQARGERTRAGAQAPTVGVGIGDALLAGAALTLFAFNDQIKGFIDGVQENLLNFVNNVQKIFFTLNQGLIRLESFINNRIVSRIGDLILDFRTNPKLVNISTKVEKTLKNLRGIIDDAFKFVGKIFEVLGSAFRFVGSIFRVPLAIVSNGVSEAIIAAAKLNPTFKFFKGIGRIFGKLFLPLTIFITAWDTIKGAVEGFQENGIIGSLEGAVDGFFNSLIFMPLEMIFDATSWLLGKLGFPKTAKTIGDFNPTEVFDQITDIVFQPIYDAVEWIKTAFTDPKEALNQLWLGLVGEGGLVDLVWWPVNLAVNFIKDIFNLGDPDQPFRMGAFIEGLITQTVDIFAQIFNRFMNMLKSIPVVKEFFKSEQEKALEQRRRALEEEISQLGVDIENLEQKKSMDERKLLLMKRQGGPEQVPLGGRNFGESLDDAIIRRKEEQAAAAQRIQNLSAQQLLKRMEAMQTGQMLQLAEKQLNNSQGQGGSGTVIIDNSQKSSNSQTQVIGQTMPSAHDSYYMTYNPLTGTGGF